MKLSELVEELNAILIAEGDMEAFHRDMKPLEKEFFPVEETITEGPEEREAYGDKYIHFGDW